MHRDVTGFTTFIAVVGTMNLVCWSTHRRKVGQAIETQPEKRVAVDGVLVALGLFSWDLRSSSTEFVY